MWGRISRANRQVWPSTAPMVADRRGGFQGYFGRASGDVARLKVTDSVEKVVEIIVES
jgi:hypothetical protein